MVDFHPWPSVTVHQELDRDLDHSVKEHKNVSVLFVFKCKSRQYQRISLRRLQTPAASLITHFSEYLTAK